MYKLTFETRVEAVMYQITNGGLWKMYELNNTWILELVK